MLFSSQLHELRAEKFTSENSTIPDQCPSGNSLDFFFGNFLYCLRSSVCDYVYSNIGCSLTGALITIQMSDIL